MSVYDINMLVAFMSWLLVDSKEKLREKETERQRNNETERHTKRDRKTETENNRDVGKEKKRPWTDTEVL